MQDFNSSSGVFSPCSTSTSGVFFQAILAPRTAPWIYPAAEEFAETIAT